jgi:hypothetical protein
MAKEFSKEAGDHIKQEVVGNFIVKYDSKSRRVFVGRADNREIRTFYKADNRSADPFKDAIELAKKLTK